RAPRAMDDRFVERAVAARLAVALPDEDPEQNAFFGDLHGLHLPGRALVLRSDHVAPRGDVFPRRVRVASPVEEHMGSLEGDRPLFEHRLDLAEEPLDMMGTVD